MSKRSTDNHGNGSSGPTEGSNGHKPSSPLPIASGNRSEEALSNLGRPSPSPVAHCQPGPSNRSLIGSYRRPSLTFGTRPVVIPSSPIPRDLESLSPFERERMGIEEQDLLRDSKGIPSDYGTLGTSSSSSSTTQNGANLEAAYTGETTALLGCRTDDISKWDEAIAAGLVHTSYTREAKTLVKYAAPLWLTFLLQYSLTFASLFSAGTLGKNELASVTLASMTANITGYAVYQGKFRKKTLTYDLIFH